MGLEEGPYPDVSDKYSGEDNTWKHSSHEKLTHRFSGKRSIEDHYDARWDKDS